MNILYMSYDGMTDPLGQSQVIPYLAGLSAKGHRFSLISFEKKDRFEKQGSFIAGLLRHHQIQWLPLSYSKTPPVLATLWDVWRMQVLAGKTMKSANIQVVHCRSYIAALVGLKLKKKYGCRFVFDMRGFWADERVEGKLWNLNNPVYKLIYTYFKRKEKEFFLHADQIISLTENASRLIQSWKLKGNVSLPITVIPCCADLSHFNRMNVDTEKRNQWMKILKIQENDFILGYLGAIGTWYLLDEMLIFFRILLQSKPAARFLFITQEPEDLIRAAVLKNGVPPASIIITSSSRADLPSLLSLLTLSVFFIRPSFSKRASSPTKQGEIMSMGVPILCNSGIGDTDNIIRNSEAGMVISDFSEETFRQAVKDIGVLLSLNSRTIIRGAEKYYSLERGIEKYQEVYRKLE